MTVRYDLNPNPDTRVSSGVAVAESLIRNMPAFLNRDRVTGAPLPFISPREKARCGIKLRVSLKSVAEASGL